MARFDVDQFRERVLPRTALGLATLLLFSALGAAFSGAVLFAYYQVRLDQNEDEVAALVDGFDERIDKATGEIADERDAATDQIRKELEPLEQLAATGETLAGILESAAPSTWFVSTRDEAGQPSAGTAFVVASDRNQTFLLTSYEVVKAATVQPAPAIKIRLGDDERDATLWTWDEGRDLAVLLLQAGNQTALEWANDSIRTGDRVFAVSGLGSAGGAISQGAVADVSSAGIQHTTPVGSAFRGAPLVNSRGEVVSVASSSFSPLGFPPGDVPFGIDIRDACEKVLRCPSGNQADGATDRR